MQTRHLTKVELAIAKPVFQSSLPWHRIRLSDGLGAGKRPYTWLRTLHIGPTHFKGMNMTPHGARLLVHELTYVWQSEHSGSRLAYRCGARVKYALELLAAQAARGQNAYVYAPGKNWDDYNPEEQAEIVADWFFRDGRSENSTLFPYIRDHIRKKTVAADDNIEYPATF